MQRSELIHLNSLENFNKQRHFVDELIYMYLLKILLNIETKVILSFWYIYIFYILYWTGECGNCRPVVIQSDNRVFFGGGRVNVVVRRGGTCPRDSDRHPHPETRRWYVSQSLIKPGIFHFRVSLNLLKISVSGSH